MRSSDLDMLIIRGLGDSGPDHWQSRWESKIKTARRVVQADWHRPDRAGWVAAIVAEAARSTRPVLLVAHSLGVLAAVHAAPELAALGPGRVVGALLVAPPDMAGPAMPPEIAVDFGPTPCEPLPFPAMVIASRTDPWCDFAVADDLAAAWGAVLADAGESGHINSESGHGPWPEGLTRLMTLLGRI